MEGFDSPNTRGAGVETEARHPTHPDDPPDSYGRTQLIGLALFIGVPIVIYLLVRLF
jgi:hypothetical protein